MTDRELLELASKACGLEEAKMRIEFNQWNPLEDDGDALRLAVKLRMVLDTSTGNNIHVQYPFGTMLGHLGFDECDPDPYAATRRAITRAAAEVGRNMK
jgi:hypothetical protein